MCYRLHYPGTAVVSIHYGTTCCILVHCWPCFVPVLFKVSGQSLAGIEHILLRRNIVPIENLAAQMSAKFHTHLLRSAGPHEVSDERTPKVMIQQSMVDQLQLRLRIRPVRAALLIHDLASNLVYRRLHLAKVKLDAARLPRFAELSNFNSMAAAVQIETDVGATFLAPCMLLDLPSHRQRAWEPPHTCETISVLSDVQDTSAYSSQSQNSHQHHRLERPAAKVAKRRSSIKVERRKSCCLIPHSNYSYKLRTLAIS